MAKILAFLRTLVLVSAFSQISGFYLPTNRDHCEEQGAPVPTEPVVFNKFPSCIVGPTDPLPYPEVTEELDWEVCKGLE